ncbi:MAG TPA: serine hydrolase domain-containing protein [Anaeromyxobacter sp.]|nr:serine hydrolase domain-containing protein [Anaeromyxobacter sp.]
MRFTKHPAVVFAVVFVACRTSGAVPRPAPPAQPQPVSWADPARVEKLVTAAAGLENVVAELAEKSGAPGVAVGVVADGRLAWFEAVGVRDVKSRAPVDQDTVFRIASMTKAFVVAAVLRLRDEGKLSLDDPAEKHLPELRGLAYPTRDSPRITVRHLLSHASGLPEDNATGDLKLPMPEAEFDRLLAAGFSFSSAPGSQFEYSNLAFALAGRIVTRVSGMRVQDYVSRNLLAPLGMLSTRWNGSEVPAEHRAHGYGRKGSAMPSAGLAKYEDEGLHEEEALGDGAFAAPAGLWTSPRDYARWVAFQLSAWPPRDAPDGGPVRRASLREAQEVQRALPVSVERDHRGELDVDAGGYGLGWWVISNCSFERMLTHSGLLPGYGSYVFLLPEHGVGLFAMTNLTYTSGRNLVRTLARELGARGVLPKRPVGLSPALARTCGAIIDLLATWDPERAAAMFDASYGSYEPLDKLRARLGGVARAHGACRPAADADPENAMRGRMRLACERGQVDVSVELTSDVPPRIQSLVLDSFLPPTPALAAAGEAATGLLARWEDGAAAGLFAPRADLAAVRASFARVTRNQGACALSRAVKSDGAARATFLLACERGEAHLDVELDPATGRAATVAASTAPGTMRCPL